MAKARRKAKVKKQVETLKHDVATRKNIPTAEHESLLHDKDKTPIQVAYERRNHDLDPQLVWRGKDKQDDSLVVPASPLYIQEKVHPKVLIDDLLETTEKTEADKSQDEGSMADMFSDFNGLPDEHARTEFYQHDANWTNRMILGDGLQVMTSLAEREGLRGKVQCIYIDPPYGIKFNSNFQWSTTNRDVKDGKREHITREPEQVKAFRDTWQDGIHSYLTYLRDRLTVAHDLLTDSGSVFVQIGDENVHHIRELMDEIFGDENFIHNITFQKTGYLGGNFLDATYDHIIWVAKNKSKTKYNPIFTQRSDQSLERYNYIEEQIGITTKLSSDHFNKKIPIPHGKRWQDKSLFSDGETRGESSLPFKFRGRTFEPISGKHWSTGVVGLGRLDKADRIVRFKDRLRLKSFSEDFPIVPMTVVWTGMMIGRGLNYVVETSEKVVQRCLLMATDPGDLVLDPTCGSGTTAYVAEELGRRWITIDTSRVALALARGRIMAARYPYYLLADSKEGQEKEADVTHSTPSSKPTYKNIHHGFVYERVPHITLKSIAHNTEIDVIYDEWQKTLEPLRKKLNTKLKQSWQEWEIPREADDSWTDTIKQLHTDWWQARIDRQQEIDASIAAKAEFEYLYDKPYEDKKTVRVAGPFTVESSSPHHILAVDENDELIRHSDDTQEFIQMILENLKVAGVQQVHKEDKIDFTSLTAWPGNLVCGEGRYTDESDNEKRAAIFIGPEFGTVSRSDLVEAAKEAGDADFNILISCAFNYDAHSTEFEKLGRVPVLKAHMNADLHMADDLKTTSKGNLFVIFGEPDIDILDAADNQIQVKIKGVDVFHPNTGEVRSDSSDGIACWFIDTDYNEVSFFVRHAYFLGANDPYKSLKTTLKAEINQEAWATLNSDVSRPFSKPKDGRIAVKVINHLGDEVMKVYKV